MLPFAPMSATSEAPAAFRHAAARPGPFRLLGEAIEDILLAPPARPSTSSSADIKKKGADTFLGNLWWVLDPLLQMVRVRVFVSLILQRPQPDYPLFMLAAILPWKWFTSSIDDAATSVIGPGVADPADPVPEARAARGGHHGRRSSDSRSACCPSARSCCCTRIGSSAFLLLIPVIAVRPVRVHARGVAPRLPR